MIYGPLLPFTTAKGWSHDYITNDIFNYITKIFMRCILVEAGPTAGEWNHSFIITNQHQGIWNVKRCSLLLVNKLHIWWPSMQFTSSHRALRSLGTKLASKTSTLSFIKKILNENTAWIIKHRNKMCFKDFHNDTNDVKLPNWVDAS